MYSMISAPVLGFDLVRMSGGAHVAQVMACALRLDEQGLLTLATLAGQVGGSTGDDLQQRELARTNAWLDISMSTQDAGPGRGGLAGLSQSLLNQLGQGEPAEEDDTSAADKLAHTLARRAADSAAIAAVLEQAPLGSLDALLRCLREEVLDWVAPLLPERTALEVGLLEAGVTLLCDAAAAAYTHDVLPADAFEALWQPWQQAHDQLEPRYQAQAGRPEDAAGLAFPVQGTPCAGLQLDPPVQALLDHLAGVDASRLEAIAQASNRWRFRDPSWSTAVHDASWAVTLAGRTREAALAQMRLVQICRQVGWPVPALAGGDWNTISGAIHALSVADLISAETLHRLTAPCTEVFGPLPGTVGEQAA
jgi:hypothetical protein